MRLQPLARCIIDSTLETKAVSQNNSSLACLKLSPFQVVQTSKCSIQGARRYESRSQVVRRVSEGYESTCGLNSSAGLLRDGRAPRSTLADEVGGPWMQPLVSVSNARAWPEGNDMMRRASPRSKDSDLKGQLTSQWP